MMPCRLCGEPERRNKDGGVGLVSTIGERGTCAKCWRTRTKAERVAAGLNPRSWDAMHWALDSGWPSLGNEKTREAIELLAVGPGKSAVEVNRALGKAFTGATQAAKDFGAVCDKIFAHDRKWVWGFKRDHDAKFTTPNAIASKPYGQRRKNGK